jgi:hypothetical protein
MAHRIEVRHRLAPEQATIAKRESGQLARRDHPDLVTDGCDIPELLDFDTKPLLSSDQFIAPASAICSLFAAPLTCQRRHL